MSADNGIFIFNTPDHRIAVVHYTLSGMPEGAPNLLHNKKTVYGDPVYFFGEHEPEKAKRKAMELLREVTANDGICEYGICDWTDASYEVMMAPYTMDVTLTCKACTKEYITDHSGFCTICWAYQL